MDLNQETIEITCDDPVMLLAAAGIAEPRLHDKWIPQLQVDLSHCEPLGHIMRIVRTRSGHCTTCIEREDQTDRLATWYEQRMANEYLRIAAGAVVVGVILGFSVGVLF